MINNQKKCWKLHRQKRQKNMNYKHIPVLAQEVYEKLPNTTKIILDWTVWHWGHIEYILSKLSKEEKHLFDSIQVIWVDRDNSMLQKAKTNTKNFEDKIEYINCSYHDLSDISNISKVGFFDVILLDLWVNLEHLKQWQRGFSIKTDWPLDMRYDTKQDITAKDLINNLSTDKLAEVFGKYGDFGSKFAWKIANYLSKKNKKDRIDTTGKLVEALKEFGLNQKKIAVIFQCLRIQTNKELFFLESFLEEFGKYLNVWGVCIIITYHSIEDRMVKYKFKELANTSFELVNKKVIKPNYKETLSNRAARSAKLRIIKKL